jgi:hypothetical protein
MADRMLPDAPKPSLVENLRRRPRLVAGIAILALITVTELLLAATVFLLVALLFHLAQ